MTFLKNNAKDTNMSGLLAENGELQKQVNRLEKIQNEMKIDVESAIARDKLLRSRDTDVTSHHLIPYLWVISILFIGVGLVIFKMSAPTLGLSMTTVANGSPSTLGMVTEFITNKVVLGSLLVSAIIVIIFLSLKVAGVFGK
jgi:hypothetical protein